MKSKKLEKVLIHVDGACSGNPGDSGIGVVIYDQASGYREEISQYIGTGTNNTAEYTALIIALRRAQVLKATQICVKSDSELLVRQMIGQYKIKNDNLKQLFKTVIELASAFQAFDIQHVRREFNKEADSLAKKAIDEHRRANRMVAVSAKRDIEESPSSTGQRSG